MNEDFTNCISLGLRFSFAALVLERNLYAKFASDITLPGIPLNIDMQRGLRVPTLALLGHALEMILKAGAYLNGSKPPTYGPKGHDIDYLWNLQHSRLIRERVLHHANIENNNGKTDPVYSSQGEVSDFDAWFVKVIQDLGELHKEEGNALRYGSRDPKRMAPPPTLIAKALFATAEEMSNHSEMFIVNQ